MQQNKANFAITIIILAGIVIASVALAFVITKLKLAGTPMTPPKPKPKLSIKIAPFESEKDFTDYLNKAEASESYYPGILESTVEVPAVRIDQPGRTMQSAQPAPSPISTLQAQRVSQTNIQVQGIDEPDIVKTDGTNIYFSSRLPVGILPIIERLETESPPILEGTPPSKPIKRQISNATRIIRAFPPASLSELSAVPDFGDLLLDKNTLIVFSTTNRRIAAYDVSNPADPKEKWSFELKNSNQFLTARLYKGKLYVVLQKSLGRPRPCPLMPLSGPKGEIIIPCKQIYHPITPIPIKTIYTVLILNPQDGGVKHSKSFLGTYGSVVYMSPNAVYLTYPVSVSIFDFAVDFFNTDAKDLIPEPFSSRIQKLLKYKELSDAAKFTEMEIILKEYFEYLDSLNEDEQSRIENELANRMSKYIDKKARKLETTNITKLSLDNLDIIEEGSVPGRLLNQFSLDEYDGYLRIATTIGKRGSLVGRIGFLGPTRFSSMNDVYVLDEKLNIVGEVKDLGITERIYSARFVGSRGYIVTFRETDPFYIIDLSNPRKPKMTGLLKIPGFSSYLHPIDENTVLGVGREESQIKISLFDVSDSANPKEKSKYLLNEYWSEIMTTHHAFLLDSKFSVFFLPGSKGGYIFSYKSGNLELKRVVSGIQVKRAVFLDDYLYIIGEKEIVVINEDDWQDVNRLEL